MMPSTEQGGNWFRWLVGISPARYDAIPQIQFIPNSTRSHIMNQTPLSPRELADATPPGWEPACRSSVDAQQRFGPLSNG
jgi:hypothetical protein